MKRISFSGVLLVVMLLVSPILVYSAPAGPPGGLGVKVINDATEPVQIEGIVEIIEPAIELFQAESTCNTNGSGCTSENMFTVPTGKFAIVEYASARAYLPANNALGAGVRTTLNSVELLHKLSDSVVSPIERSIGIGQQVRLYADPGTVITMTGGTNGDAVPSFFTVYFTISGHLVDLP